jgi:hypothetical protein
MTKTGPQENFWKWFIQHQAELLNFEVDQERIFDELAAELQKVDPDLCFEFGPGKTQREFIVSAGGIKRAFPAVVSLVDAAPSLPQWQIIAFRPRRTPINAIEFRGKSIDPNDVQFTLLDNGETCGLYLFIPDIRDDDFDLQQIGYLLLDEALGEYDVETQLGLIKMLSPDTPTKGDRHRFEDLPALFEQLVSRLEGRSGKPS